MKIKRRDSDTNTDALFRLKF